MESLTGHWVPGNREGDGFCTLPDCWGTSAAHKGTVECLLLSCPSLSMTREALTEYSLTFLQAYPLLLPLVLECLALDPVQFWLDCSTMPGVISSVQEGNEENVLFVLLKLTRNYCHDLHKARHSLLQCEYYYILPSSDPVIYFYLVNICMIIWVPHMSIFIT